jgi:hypothetical protein
VGELRSDRYCEEVIGRLAAGSETVPDCSEGSNWGGEEVSLRWFGGVLSRVVRFDNRCNFKMCVRLVTCFGDFALWAG